MLPRATAFSSARIYRMSLRLPLLCSVRQRPGIGKIEHAYRSSTRVSSARPLPHPNANAHAIVHEDGGPLVWYEPYLQQKHEYWLCLARRPGLTNAK